MKHYFIRIFRITLLQESCIARNKFKTVVDKKSNSQLRMLCNYTLLSLATTFGCKCFKLVALSSYPMTFEPLLSL